MTTQEARAQLRESKFGKMTMGQLMEKEVQSAHKEDLAEMMAYMMMEGFG